MGVLLSADGTGFHSWGCMVAMVISVVTVVFSVAKEFFLGGGVSVVSMEIFMVLISSFYVGR